MTNQHNRKDQQTLEGTMNEDKHYTEIRPKWHSPAEVAQMLGFGLSKTKMLIISGEIRSVKDGKYRRILPEWVDEYIARRVHESEAA